jgi:hypothetical protein
MLHGLFNINWEFMERTTFLHKINGFLLLTCAVASSAGDIFAANSSPTVREIRGSGVIEMQEHVTGAYDKVVLDIPYVVQLQLGPEQNVSVITDTNVQPLIKIEVVKKTLHVSLAEPGSCIRATVLAVRLQAHNLADIRLVGRAALQAKGLTIGDAAGATGNCNDHRTDESNR